MTDQVKLDTPFFFGGIEVRSNEKTESYDEVFLMRSVQKRGNIMNENTGRLYGYIRVSTREQNEDRQRLAMQEFGVPDGLVYMDKQSGKDFERPGYKRLMKKIKPGDTLVIKSIDRLGRNYDGILEQWRSITREKQAAIGAGSDRYVDCGYRSAASQLCGADRTGVYPPTSGRRDCCSKGKRCAPGQETDESPGQFSASL